MINTKYVLKFLWIQKKYVRIEKELSSEIILYIFLQFLYTPRHFIFLFCRM